MRGVLGTIGWEISNFNNSELSFLGVSSVEVSVEGKVPLERIAKKVWTQGEEDYLPAKPAKILGFEEKDIDGKSMDREKLTRFFFVRQENATTPSNDFCVTLIEPATVIIFLTSPEGLLRKAAIKKNGLWDELPKPQAEPKFHKEVEFWLKELGGAQS
ncbi:MAG: hypothetical protein HY921_10280 [Elusimicrobia bacterium]|nr:hypothetical protein [Elusimicrobiota bacterium]